MYGVLKSYKYIEIVKKTYCQSFKQKSSWKGEILWEFERKHGEQTRIGVSEKATPTVSKSWKGRSFEGSVVLSDPPSKNDNDTLKCFALLESMFLFL